MIVDTSAVVAVLLDEPDALRFATAMMSAGGIGVSAATRVEMTLVLEGRGGERAGTNLDRLLADAQAEIIPFTETRGYVKAVLANAAVYASVLNGGDVPSLKPMLGEVSPGPATPPSAAPGG